MNRILWTRATLVLFIVGLAGQLLWEPLLQGRYPTLHALFAIAAFAPVLALTILQRRPPPLRLDGLFLMRLGLGLLATAEVASGLWQLLLKGRYPIAYAVFAALVPLAALLLIFLGRRLPTRPTEP